MIRPSVARVSNRPTPGHYALRLVKGGVWVGAEIRLGGDGWRVMVAGEWQGPSDNPWSLPLMEKVHHYGTPIPKSECEYLVARGKHDALYNPSSPHANPSRPIDPDSLPPPI